MKNPLLLAAPFLLLSACNSQPKAPEVLDSNPDPMANRLAAAPKAELPPSIRKDTTLRCADGSLVGVTFFQGDTLVAVRAPSTATPVRLTAPEAGKPYAAEGGWTLSGDEKAVTLTAPGKKALSCHA